MNITQKKTEAESKPKDKSTEETGQDQGVSPAVDRDVVAASTKTKEGECFSMTDTLFKTPPLWARSGEVICLWGRALEGKML